MTKRDSGTGAITKRGDRRWMIRLELGRDPGTGNRRRHHETVRGTKRDAQRRLSELQQQLTVGVGIPPDRITVAEYLRSWLNDHVAPRVTARTTADYGQTVAIFSELIGNVRLRDLRPDHIASALATYQARGRAGRTVQKHFVVLKGALGQAVQLGLINRNPADAISRPRADHREMQTADEETIQRVLSECADDDLRRLIYVAIQTGLRAGELLGLRWGDVDWENSQLHLQRARNSFERSGFAEPKAHSRRSVAISAGTIDALREHRVVQAERRLSLGELWQGTDLIFPRTAGVAETVNNLSKRWGALRDRISLDGLRFHDLRHTSATLALKAGVHPKVVQERLGHSNIGITLDTYSHVLPNMQREAAEALDALVPRPATRQSAG